MLCMLPALRAALHCEAVTGAGRKPFYFRSLLSNSGHQYNLLTSYVPLDVHDQPLGIVSVVHGLHFYHSGLNSRFVL